MKQHDGNISLDKSSAAGRRIAEPGDISDQPLVPPTQHRRLARWLGHIVNTGVWIPAGLPKFSE